MRKSILVLLIIILSTINIACQSSVENTLLIDKVSHISISESQGFGRLNEKFVTSIIGVKATTAFEEILNNTSYVRQDIDFTNTVPDYDILISYKNGGTHGLHLILGSDEEESTIMFIGHEKKNQFVVSAEDTKLLKELLNTK